MHASPDQASELSSWRSVRCGEAVRLLEQQFLELRPPLVGLAPPLHPPGPSPQPAATAEGVGLEGSLVVVRPPLQLAEVEAMVAEGLSVVAHPPLPNAEVEAVAGPR